MNPELLCTWLGLQESAWPPNAWTLLGVRKEERNLAVIEKRVHDCMTKLRCYQLSYPEEATEGMNRLAEAFITLSEACTKQETYAVAATPGEATADWRSAPPPVRYESAETKEQEPADVPIGKPYAPPPGPICRAVDPAVLKELAERSEEATSDLATLEALIDRIDRTRALLDAWDKLGKPLKATAKKVSTKENDSFAAKLDKVHQAMQGYPAFLGQPGKPGYRVVVQVRLRMPLAMLRAMPDVQRAELLFDWLAGRQVLLLHRKYLHRLFKTMRHRTAVGLFLHAVRAMVNDYPLPSLAGAGFLAIVIIGVVMWLKR